MILRLLLFVFFFALRSVAAFSYPEFVRHGYPSCTSCHVSPSGGGMLTDYGRSYSAEKLSSFSYPGEEKPLHGLIKEMPEWLLVGGNFRQIQTYIESPQMRDGRWIIMQRDIDACLKNSTVYVCATSGITHTATQNDTGKLKYGLRKASVRYDWGDSLIFRVGRFYPRFGLMTANHTSAVRRGMGFKEMGETDQAEVNYLSEFFELTASQDFGRIVKLNSETDEEREQFAKGGVVTLSVPIGEASRAGASYRYAKKDLRTHSYGLFAAWGMSEKTYILAEVDQTSTVLSEEVPGQDKIQRNAMTLLKVGTEILPGFIGYGVHEINLANIKESNMRRDTYGVGAQWFPRPHWEFDASWSHILSRQDSTYTTLGYLVLHYYL